MLDLTKKSCTVRLVDGRRMRCRDVAVGLKKKGVVLALGTC